MATDIRPWYKKKRYIISCGVLAVVFISLLNGSDSVNNVASTGCKVPNPPISYDVVEEKTRDSDVKNIKIVQCYILLGEVFPTTEKLIDLAVALGKNNRNIEFKIFDDKEAIKIDKKFREIMSRGGNENEIPDSEWVIWDNHFIGTYLKAKTALTHNSLSIVSDSYDLTHENNTFSIEN